MKVCACLCMYARVFVRDILCVCACTFWQWLYPFFCSAWNVFDALVVFISILGIIITELPGTYVRERERKGERARARERGRRERETERETFE